MAAPDPEFRQYAPDECTGKDDYPPEWHDTIKHAVREQAGNRCVRCLHPYVKGAGQWSPCDIHCTHGGPYRYEWNGIMEDAPEGKPAGITALLIAPREVEAAWRILTVHHLDGDKGNCRWWTLAALCQRCHLEIQGKVRMDRRWLREHSPWFRPYVAGYYAATILGEDLSREQVVARQGELLALEARQLALDCEARP
jgi:hypothetical protein